MLFVLAGSPYISHIYVSAFPNLPLFYFPTVDKARVGEFSSPVYVTAPDELTCFGVWPEASSVSATGVRGRELNFLEWNDD